MHRFWIKTIGQFHVFASKNELKNITENGQFGFENNRKADQVFESILYDKYHENNNIHCYKLKYIYYI